MVERARGNLLNADTEALVNAVNGVGVMGKGIALQFKQTFPENFRQYKRVCDRGDLEPGRVFVFDRGALLQNHAPRYIINVPTKTHWRPPSTPQYIEAGMAALVHAVRQRAMSSVALPALGCGGGGLDWATVEPIITSHLAALPDVRFVLYPPSSQAGSDASASGPTMTCGRALLLLLMARCQRTCDGLGRRSVHKLAYFLQAAGHDLRLAYVADDDGPSAAGVDRVLQHMNGGFIGGYAGREQASKLRLLSGAVAKADNEIASNPDAQAHLDRVGRLIDGFETPFGMELLATVLWVTTEAPRAQTSIHEVIRDVHRWSRRKKELFAPHHIEVAWERLRAEGWLDETNGLSA